MKNTIWSFTLLIMTAGSQLLAGTGDEEDSRASTKGPAYSLNVAKSTVFWEGNKPGGTHTGTIDVISGSASTNGKLVTSGSFEIDMASIKNEDVGNDGMREKLVGHLKSEDFFYVEKYPRAYFRITGSEAGQDREQMITGDLTIRGTTHPISFPAEISMDEKTIRAITGEIVLDRTKWDVNHMSKSVVAQLKDNYIDDEMIVKLDIHFSRQ